MVEKSMGFPGMKSWGFYAYFWKHPSGVTRAPTEKTGFLGPPSVGWQSRFSKPPLSCDVFGYGNDVGNHSWFVEGNKSTNVKVAGLSPKHIFRKLSRHRSKIWVKPGFGFDSEPNLQPLFFFFDAFGIRVSWLSYSYFTQKTRCSNCFNKF